MPLNPSNVPPEGRSITFPKPPLTPRRQNLGDQRGAKAPGGPSGTGVNLKALSYPDGRICRLEANERKLGKEKKAVSEEGDRLRVWTDVGRRRKQI